MASPLGDRTEPKPTDSVYEQVLSQFQDDLTERLNVEQMFILIDGVLPFEACLYYQVLPLFIEGSRLHLGMVSTNDTSATDYVRRIVSYHNFSLLPRSISSEALQSTLSAYLNYSGKQQTSGAQRQSFPLNRLHRSTGRSRADQILDPALQRTLVVDSPDQLEPGSFKSLPVQGEPAPPPIIPFTPANPVKPQPSTKIEVEDEELSPTPPPTEVQPAAEEEVSPSIRLPLLPPLPALEIRTNHLSSPPELIATLPPKDLLQELLGRVLHGGIGRLYFERQPQYGRVLWSQNGVLQSVLDRLEIEVFQGVINELKRMTNLPLLPIHKPQHIELERLYQQNRIMLLFKFISRNNGEEVTLQVLRGAALKFYQQQQLATLERDALSIAKQLQMKISEIRDRARSEAGLAEAKLDALPALSQLLKHIEEQLGSLKPDEHLPDP